MYGGDECEGRQGAFYYIGKETAFKRTDLERKMEMSDAVTSVRVPPGYQVTLYEDDG